MIVGSATDVPADTVLIVTLRTAWKSNQVKMFVAEVTSLGEIRATLRATGADTEVADVIAVGVTVTTRWAVGEPTAVAEATVAGVAVTASVLDIAGEPTEGVDTTLVGVMRRMREGTVAVLTEVAAETSLG